MSAFCCNIEQGINELYLVHLLVNWVSNRFLIICLSSFWKIYQQLRMVNDNQNKLKISFLNETNSLRILTSFSFNPFLIFLLLMNMHFLLLDKILSKSSNFHHFWEIWLSLFWKYLHFHHFLQNYLKNHNFLINFT